MGQNSSTTDENIDPKLVGQPNEVQVKIDGISTTALCDTGSCVSTCSEKFYEENLANKELKPLNNLLNIECADGSQLPYKGYIEADLEAVGIPKSKGQASLFLVVPDTQYNSSTPFLIGTNILKELLDECKMQHGVQFLQKAQLFTPWYSAFKCMTLRERELRRNNNKIATVRCAEGHNIRLGPNQAINITCTAEREVDHEPTCALISATGNSSLPDFIDITPAIVHFDSGRQEIVVNLTNLTTNTVNIAPRSILAELQPVTVDESVHDDSGSHYTHDVLQDLHIGHELTEDQQKQVRDLLNSHRDIFSTGDEDIGQCNLFKHRIELNNETPFKQRHRRIPPGMVEEVRKHLEQLLSAGIIRKSKSPWASNIVLVRKKNGKLRMCVDYRMLNNRTIKDAYALPRVEDVFDCLHGAKYFSTIDMKSGYHQVEVEEQHKDRTAFTVGPLGFFEFNKMPFGLSNSPATYQRLMEECLGDFNMKICVIYLDDLIIFSNSFEQHLERLHLILTRLKECGIKLAPEKCFFIQKRIKFLGHIVSEDGIETDPEKIDKIRNYPRPSNPDELRSFLAFCGYYRKFVKDFSKVTRPLSDLLPPSSPKKKNKANQQPLDWKWEEIHQYTFDKLKEMLTSPPILAYPDFDQPFELHTDASIQGLGAVLYQKQDGQKKVISFASRSLSKSEKNYSAFKLEFLALKWAVTEKFSDFLLGNKFTVYTDNNPLTHILSSAKLEATGQRWIAALSNYNFDIVYRPGVKNIDADTLSRYPATTHHTDTIEGKTVKAICNTIYATPFIEILPSQNINIVETTDTSGEMLAQVEMREIRKQQREDPIIGVWHRATVDKQLPRKQLIASDPKHQTMKRHFKNFHIIRGLLYRKHHDNEQEINQLVLPTSFKTQVLQGLHNDVGHPGKDRTASLVRDRFYWPGYTSDIDKWVQRCDRCLRRKSNVSKAPMVSIESSYPLERVCMDFLTCDPCQGNIGNILVITDHYTKFSVAVPTKNQTAKTTAEALFDNFFVHYGIPSKLHSDQGKNFESDLMKELCKLMNIQKTRTTIYHPMGNGQTERYNRTLLDMLGTLEHEKKRNWKKYLPSLVYSYNATKHESTGFSPFELMFGRKPRLPIDSVFQLDNVQDSYTSDYVKELKERLEATHEIANKALSKARQKQKVQFDKRAKASQITVGDTVLVKILAFEGKHKIADKFEQKIYKVVSQPNENIPVYIVKNEDGTERRLHRNHLLPIEATEMDVGETLTIPKELKVEKKEDTVKTKPIPKPRVLKKKQQLGKVRMPPLNIEKQERDWDTSDSEDSYMFTYSCDIDRPAGRVNSKTLHVPELDKVSAIDVDKDTVTFVDEVHSSQQLEVSSPEVRSADAVVEDSEEPEEDDIQEDDVQADDVQEVDVQEDMQEIERSHSLEGLAPPDIVRAADPPPQPPPRRSSRVRKEPTWHKDYMVSKQQILVKDDSTSRRNRELEMLLKEQASLTARLLSTVIP